MDGGDQNEKSSDKSLDNLNAKSSSRTKRPRSENDDDGGTKREKKRHAEEGSSGQSDAVMDAGSTASLGDAAANAAADAGSAAAPTSDEDVRQQPRRYGIEIGGVWSDGIDNRLQLADAIDNIKPADAQVREILKTKAGKIIIFPESVKDYNVLLKKERWGRTDLTITPAPKSTSKNAVIILNVDKTCTNEYVLGELRKKGFNPTGCARMKRSLDGAITPSVKVFMNSETEMEKIMTDGIFMYRSFHRVKRYIVSRARMCFKCQELDHLQRDCKNQRRCLKCSKNHHHSDCLAQPDLYLCVNCSGNHVSNDLRCPKQQEAKAREDGDSTSNGGFHSNSSSTGSIRVESAMSSVGAASSTGNSGSYAGALHQQAPHQIQTDLSSSIREAVREAVAEAFSTSARTLASEISKAFAAEMRREFDGLKVLIERYVASRNRGSEEDDDFEDADDELEDDEEEAPDEDDDMSISEDGDKQEGQNGNHSSNCSSTPNPSGLQARKGRSDPQALRQLGPLEPTMKDSAAAYTISLPPATFNIPKDKTETEIAKIFQDEISSRAKLLRKDIQEIQFKILSQMDGKLNNSTHSLPETTTEKKKRGRPRKTGDEAPVPAPTTTSTASKEGVKGPKPTKKGKGKPTTSPKNGS